MKLKVFEKKKRKNWPLIIGLVISLLSIPSAIFWFLSSKPKGISKPTKNKKPAKKKRK